MSCAGWSDSRLLAAYWDEDRGRRPADEWCAICAELEARGILPVEAGYSVHDI